MIRRFCFAVLFCVSVFFSGCTSDGTRAGTLRITVLDVGQGDGIVIETPGGHVCVVDGGGEPAGRGGELPVEDTGERFVVPFLRHEGVNRVDLIVLTHPHDDHVGGLPAVMRAFPVGCVLDGTVLPLETAPYRAFLDEVKQTGVSYRRIARGTHLDFRDGVQIDALSPPENGLPFGTKLDNGTINNYSCVLRVSYGATRVLLDGDAQAEAEADMLATYAPADLRCDVLKAGHHGSRNASTAAWLAATHPQAVVVSCGRHNRFGHPNREMLGRCAAQGLSVYRTDEDGAVTMVSDGRRVRIATMLHPAGNGLGTIAP